MIGKVRVVHKESMTDTKSELQHIDVDEELVPHVHAKTILIVFAVALVYFAQVVNLVGVGAFGRDVAQVVGGVDKAGWLVSVVTIMTVVLGPPVSQAADYWGRRWFLIVLTAWGCIGSVIMSRATSMNMAIAGQVIAGLAYGAQPLLHAVASEVLPHRYRAGAQACVNIGSGLGAVTSILVGASLMKGNPDGFRAFWYMTAGCYAAAALVCVILYTPPPRELQLSLSFEEKLRRLDWVGYVLLAFGLVLFVMGLSWAENPYPWDDAHVLAPLLVGVAFVVALITYEWKFKPDGMFHHGLFSRDRNFPIAVGCVFVEGLVYFASNAYFPFQVSLLYETDAILAALHVAIGSLVYILASILCGIYCYQTKRIRVPIILAFAAFLTFNICMATTELGSGRAVWAYPIFLGMGLGIALCGLVTAAQLSTPPDLIAITSGLMVSMRSLGGAVGLAIYTAVFNSKLSTILGNRIAAAALPLGLPKSSLPELIGDLATSKASLLATIPGITPEIIQASLRAFLQAFEDSFRTVWITAACFGAVAVAASVFIFDPIKDFNMHIDAPAEKEEELYA